jgi:hypothetical protein
MSIYEYNEYKGPETIDMEYKLFTLHPKGTDVDPNDEQLAEKLLTTGKWQFNQPVINNIDFYIENYLPKYTAAFLNQESDPEKGEMYFGMTDDGFVQGIPYQGELDKERIYQKVRDTLKSDLIKANTDVSKYVSVEITQVDTSNFQLTKRHNKIIENYFVKKKKYISKMRKYQMRKEIWCKLMEYFGSRLHILLNTPESRRQFLSYVISKDPDNDKVISLLKSDTLFEPITGKQVHLLKNDRTTVWYWLTRWKDEMSDHVKEFKPESPIYSHKVLPLNIIITAVDMIPHWLDKSDINLYLIKFTFLKPDQDIDIKYKIDPSSSSYISCYRNVYDDDEPYCHPFGGL